MRESQKVFDTVMEELNNGEAALDLSKALQDVIAAVKLSGKSGSVTFTIDVKHAGANRVELSDKIKTKIPAMDRAKAMFFVTEKNTLSRRDPNQPELPLDDVPGVGQRPALVG